MNKETKQATLMTAPGQDLNLKKRYCLLLAKKGEPGMKACVVYNIKTWCYGCSHTDECRELNNEIKCDSCKNKICDPDNFWFNCKKEHWKICPENTVDWHGGIDPYENCPDFGDKNG